MKSQLTLYLFTARCPAGKIVHGQCRDRHANSLKSRLVKGGFTKPVVRKAA